MLRRVHVQGIKSLGAVEVELGAFTVLVGPNGCGKTSLLDEIERICAFTAPAIRGGNFGSIGGQASAARAMATGGGDAPLVWAAEDDAGDSLEVRLAIPRGHRDELSAALVRAGRPVAAAGLGGSEDPSFAPELAALAWRSQRLALVPGEIARTCPVRQELTRSGFGLAAVLSRISRNERQAYDAIQRDLARVVQGFTELVIDDVDLPGGPGFALRLDFAGAAAVPADQVSSGTLLALALLTVTHSRKMPSLLLIDDIDHGLHLGAQLELLGAIRRVMDLRASDGNPLQVVCSTHSPYMLHDVPPGEIRVMAKGADGLSRVAALTAHPEINRWEAAMTAGELWANLGEDWVLRAPRP